MFVKHDHIILLDDSIGSKITKNTHNRQHILKHPKTIYMMENPTLHWDRMGLHRVLNSIICAAQESTNDILELEVWLCHSWFAKSLESHIMSHRIISYHILSYHHIPNHIRSDHIISYHIISYYIISYHIISYRIIPYHIIS